MTHPVSLPDRRHPARRPRLRPILRRGLLAAAVVAQTLHPAPASAQDGGESLTYRGPDGTPLSATLHLPPGDGPFPALVVLSLAGVDPLVDRMGGRGWAVMVPERRGMGGAPEQQLDATFQTLAGDVAAALAHLRERGDIDPARVGLLAQGGETVVGTLAALTLPPPAYLVLLAPRLVPGDQRFRAAQVRGARRRGLGPEEVQALEELADELAAIVRTEARESVREWRVRALLDRAPVLPRQSASVPPDREGQIRFFSSRWWRDHFTVDPAELLRRLSIPTLAVQGPALSGLPPAEAVALLRGSLAAAPTEATTVCTVEERVEHALPPEALARVAAWIEARDGGGAAGGC